jgi:hypothetical protein
MKSIGWKCDATWGLPRLDWLTEFSEKERL